MRNTASKILLATLIATSSSTVFANSMWEKETFDAWIDGKAETTLLLNTNLNSFDINTYVKNRVVTLTGSVKNETEKDLAEELVLSLDDVKSVKNELTVIDEDKEKTPATVQALTDAHIKTLVITRLLMNTNVSGSDIQVETENSVVILKGSVSSSSEHDLALSIANNTPNVERVVDKLNII
ncbi:osmotically-inducible protein OsmY [Vibrio crassostreae]|uniref:BON domain-containing protein n=1 Tax=Vibrio crassostreae TaxID=246167 RepID=UPI000F4628F4|nr:BON domain-containing protein [Vibrio crassostreae]NOH74938.1 BON domain-containing protein [Vibrio crassostreae]NOI54847.1 BON domain-containing protein [Vibrio crassostreae]ROR19255.1 osmotically-inducible protein OsmY [Vibrio crassostreae]TCN76485.1 osmotically-inducible protein OsmY [Vibrio crassostreae]TWD43486.1 osmotically-inducible protein OsmY [Vibrio crassostreae]